MTQFLIGQRVIVGNEIGIVTNPNPISEGKVWVMRPSLGFASQFSVDNVKPLPNGQL